MNLPDPHHRLSCRAVSFHWAMILHMLYVLVSALGQTRGEAVQTVPHHLYRYLQKELSLAETLMRRILVLLASVCPAPVIRPPAQRAAPVGRGARSLPQAKRADVAVPRFTLLDPNVSLRARHPSAPGPVPTPRIWWPGKPEPEAPPRLIRYTPFQPRAAAGLVKRLRALQDVVANTGTHTARMARLIARQQLATADLDNLPKRDRPLRHGRAPGVSRKRLQAWWADFNLLNRCAAEFLDVGYRYDTS